MRFRSSLLVLGVIAANLSISQAAPVRKIVPKGATSFTSNGGRFSIWLPFEPRAEYEVGTMKGGEKIPFYSLVGHNSTIIYVIMAFTNPPSVRNQTAKHRLDEDQKTYLKGPDRRLLKVTPLRLGKVWGRELEISEKEDTQVLRHRVYFTPKYLYSLSARGSKAEMQKQAAQINRVFYSFRILSQK